jgi:hypothetical protein
MPEEGILQEIFFPIASIHALVPKKGFYVMMKGESGQSVTLATAVRYGTDFYTSLRRDLFPKGLTMSSV